MRFIFVLRLLLTMVLVLLSVRAMSAPALWMVQAENSAGRAYLFGSVHFGDESMYPLPPQVVQAFEQSDALVVEIDTLAISPAEVNRALRDFGRYPVGTKLNDFLTSQDELRLHATARRLHLPHEKLQRLRPWLAAMRLAAAQIIGLGFRSELGLDIHFLRQAKRRDPLMEIIPMETLAEQMAIFAHLDDQQQLAFLRQTLAELEQGDEVLRQSLQAWSTGDLVTLERLMLQSLDDFDALLGQYIYDLRNRSMVEQISALLDAGEKLFVVVGVGHLIGDEGINALLASRGYRVSRIFDDIRQGSADSRG